MLDGTGDADGDVEIGGDDFSGLADLVVVGNVACIDGGARCSDGGVEFFRYRFQHFKVLAILHAAPTGDDDLGGGEFGAI